MHGIDDESGSEFPAATILMKPHLPASDSFRTKNQLAKLTEASEQQKINFRLFNHLSQT